MLRENVERKLAELLEFRVSVQNSYEKYFEAYKMQRTVLDGIIDTLEKLLNENPEESQLTNQ